MYYHEHEFYPFEFIVDELSITRILFFFSTVFLKNICQSEIRKKSCYLNSSLLIIIGIIMHKFTVWLFIRWSNCFRHIYPESKNIAQKFKL